MLPVINPQTRKYHDDVNPFVATSQPLKIFVDTKGTSRSKELELLFNQSLNPNLYIVSESERGTGQVKYDNQKEDVLPFQVYNLFNKSWSRHGISYLSQYKRLSTDSELSRWGSSGEVERAFIIARTAEEFGAHVFVTEDKFLSERKEVVFLRDINIVSVKEALAITGLFLRRRNNFEIVLHRKDKQTIKESFSRWLYFWYMARDLVPSGWTLVNGTSIGGEFYRDLALTSISRLSGVLKCRDHIQEQLFLDQTNSSTEDAVFYLDYFLVSFSAAFDVLARLAHRIYKLKGSENYGGWRKKVWLEELKTKDSKLSGVMSPGFSTRDVLDLIAILRNSIHNQGLSATSQIKDSRPAPTLVKIPSNEVGKVTKIIGRLKTKTWRESKLGNDLFIEIGNLVENLTPLGIDALETLTKNIDISKVPNFNTSKFKTTPPKDWVSDETLRRMRLFLGL